MYLTLKTAAEYIQTSRAPRAFFAIVATVKRVFTFAQERANRPVRFLRVVRAYRNGMLVRDIEDEYGCSRNTVLRHESNNNSERVQLFGRLGVYRRTRGRIEAIQGEWE